MPSSTTDRFCVLGAGCSGLAVAKNFLQGGVAFDCLEREDDIGGNWYFGKPSSSVYASTHLISSKRLTEFTDFPMPKDYPEYPNCRLVWDYLHDYARKFGLYEHIQLNTSVERIEPCPQGWRVALAGGEKRVYRGVVIANGHNWKPRLPDYPGQFVGEVVHSAEYKRPDALRGKRVLVVGGGNSGCELAVEASIHASQAFHSVRRGYHVLPKFFKGMPIDQFNEFLLSWRLPLWARRLAAALVVRWVLGPPDASGLPKPDHRLFESHPIINSQLHYRVAHGDLAIRPDVQRLDGSRVTFVDGSEEDVDLIIYATGFEISFPFIDHQHLNWRDGRPDLFLNVFHPQRDDLFCAGLIQPDSGQWGLVDYQAQLITCYLQALKHESRRAKWFAQLKQSFRHDLNHGIQYLDSPRHRLEVEHYSYRRRLRKLIAKLA
ncbi:MAG: NAD(P)-binding domain-containing protein [Planctomycetes bacterium]|nr:NAD(P)-binding domain-containing protein [Planctomycetota bacterium]